MHTLLGLVASAAVALSFAPLLIRTPWVRHRISDAIERRMARAGVTGTFRVAASGVLGLALEDVHLVSSRGVVIVADIPRVVVHPRVGALIVGRLEPGSIDADSPVVRLAVAPSDQGAAADSLRRSVALLPKALGLPSIRTRGGRVELIGRSDRLWLAGVDVDWRASPGPRGAPAAADVRARIASGGVDAYTPEGQSTHDALCSAAAVIRITAREVDVPSLVADGVAQVEASSHLASCRPSEPASSRVAVSVTDARFALDSSSGNPVARARLKAVLPLALLDRTGRHLGIKGRAEVSGSVQSSAGWRLPEADVDVRATDLTVARRPLGRTLEAHANVSRDLVRVQNAILDAPAALVRIPDLEIQPFSSGVPLTGQIGVSRLKFGGLLRVVGVASHPHVAWTIGRAVVSKVRGTLFPL
ncbi:MAG: hypothetical protein ABSC94_10175, partial [Polyangiaceae bacterium]